MTNKKYILQKANENLLRMKTEKEHEITAFGRQYTVLQGVFSPKYAEESFFYVDSFPLGSIQDVLEIGGGTGFFSIECIIRGAKRVTVTDINETALKNIKQNAKRHDVEDKIKIVNSDLFKNIHEKFDVIFWNIPFADAPPENIFEKSVFDENYQKFREFILKAKEYLNSGGRVFIGFSKTLGDFNKIFKIVNEINAEIREISKIIIDNDYKDETLKIEYNLFEIIYKN